MGAAEVAQAAATAPTAATANTMNAAGDANTAAGGDSCGGASLDPLLSRPEELVRLLRQAAAVAATAAQSGSDDDIDMDGQQQVALEGERDGGAKPQPLRWRGSGELASLQPFGSNIPHEEDGEEAQESEDEQAAAAALAGLGRPQEEPGSGMGSGEAQGDVKARAEMLAAHQAARVAARDRVQRQAEAEAEGLAHRGPAAATITAGPAAASGAARPPPLPGSTIRNGTTVVTHRPGGGAAAIGADAVALAAAFTRGRRSGEAAAQGSVSQLAEAVERLEGEVARLSKEKRAAKAAACTQVGARCMWR